MTWTPQPATAAALTAILLLAACSDGAMRPAATPDKEKAMSTPAGHLEASGRIRERVTPDERLRTATFAVG